MMRRMRIDPQRIVRLAVLIQQGSFGRAAAQLGLTQPALSQSIALIEKEIGAKVVNRTPQGVEPTAYGQILYERAIAIDRELARAATEIQDLASGRRDVLSLGAEAGGAASLAASAVARLVVAQPEMSIRIAEQVPGPGLIRSLREGALDLVICHRPARAELVGLRSFPLFRGSRLACVRSAHPVPAGGSIRELGRFPFVCPPSELGHFFGFTHIFAAAGMEMPDVLMADSVYVAKEVVLACDAFGLFSDVSVSRELRTGELRAIDIGAPTPYWMQIVMRDEPETGPAAALLQTLSQICAELGFERPAPLPPAGRDAPG